MLLFLKPGCIVLGGGARPWGKMAVCLLSVVGQGISCLSASVFSSVNVAKQSFLRYTSLMRLKHKLQTEAKMRRQGFCRVGGG